MFRIRLTDPDIELIDNPPFAIGAEVEIEMGYLTDLEEVMTGEVAVVQPSFPETGVPSLTVIGYDRSQALRHGCKFQQFQGLNDSGIVQQVAQSNRLSPQIDGTKLPTRDSVSHLGTDWELLERLAARNGFEVFVRGKTLYFQAPGSGSGSVTLTWGKELRSFTPRVKASGLPQRVRIRDYDDAQAQAVVSSKDIGQINGDFQRGAGRFQKDVSAKLSAQGERLAREHSALTVVEADALAESLLKELAKGLVSGSGSCIGNPRLKAGGTVEIQGIGERFSGSYRLRHVTHVFGNAGYETHFEVGPKHSATLLQQLRRSLAGGVGSGPGESRRLMPLAAKVTDNKDPSGRGRVRVSFHQFSENNQGPWARVATLAAGAGSGTVFLPEVNDDVLVAFEQGDIDRPIVLGGLWDGQKKPPETNADGKNNIQMIKTKAGHLIKFDNTQGAETLLIEHSSGSIIKLEGKGGVTIEAKEKMTLKSAGDIEMHAKNVNVKVTGKMDVSDPDPGGN